jgi:mevalonate kinase
MTRYPAKLFLFGEYSVLLGSSALSMPFNSFSASLNFSIGNMRELHLTAMESNLQLKQMCAYFMANEQIFSEFLDLQTLCNDIENGLWLESSIPQRYGLGSSGAHCAAVYGAYALSSSCKLQNEAEEIVSFREHFILMESFFHGRSSGFDPLISYLNRPLKISNKGQVMAVGFNGNPMPSDMAGVLLIDSGQSCGTGPLVNNFLDEFAPGGIVTPGGKEFCERVNSVIEKFLSYHKGGLWEDIRQLSHFQLTHLKHLIPLSFRPLWEEGLQTDLFALKLSGSGGGGFLLCFTKSIDLCVSYFLNRNIPHIPVTFDSAPPHPLAEANGNK